MTVFYALNGVLISLTIQYESAEGIGFIGSFGVFSMIMFSFIAGRMRSTNSKCDKRAIILENELGFEVIKNYSSDNCPHKPRFLYSQSLHGIVMFFNSIIILLWLLIIIR